ncbi:transposase [Bradyrhizobium sp. RT11b]
MSDDMDVAIEKTERPSAIQPGARRVDDRRVISGILHVLKVGCRWVRLAADYGPSTTDRWSRRGF